MDTLLSVLLGGLLGGLLAIIVIRVFGLFWGVVILVIFFLATMPDESQAAGYRPSGRAYSAPRTVTRPTVINRTTVNKTTVIQQHHSAPRSSSGGAGSAFMGSLGGSIIGSGIGQWLFGPKEQPQQPPQEVHQEAPVVPVQPQCDATLYDCTPKVPK